MKSREETHNKIDELIQQITLHNNRLSLHEEKLSQLDVDVLRKYCIDLYEHVNALVNGDVVSTSSAFSEDKGELSEEEQEIGKEEQEIRMHIPEPEVTNADPEPVAEPEVQSKAAEIVKADNTDIAQSRIRTPKPLRKEEEEMIALFEKFNSKPIDSISKAISISKRFEIQNNFFDGDAQDYKEFIASLDAAGNRESAFEIYHEYKNRLAWDNEDLKDELKSLLYRKYHP